MNYSGYTLLFSTRNFFWVFLFSILISCSQYSYLAENADISGGADTLKQLVFKHLKGEITEEKLYQRWETLLKAGLNPNNGQVSPLWIATNSGMDICFLKLLLDYGADPNGYSMDAAGKVREMSVIGIAVTKNRPNVISFMLKNGANLSYEEDLKKTNLLLVAVSEGFYEVVEALLEGGANTDCCKRFSRPLLRAIAKKNYDIIRLLVNHNVNINQWNPLAYAISLNVLDEKLLTTLINYGGDINKINDYGDAPLHLVSKCENLDLYKLLLRYGANDSIKNINGISPKELLQDEGCDTQ